MTHGDRQTMRKVTRALAAAIAAPKSQMGRRYMSEERGQLTFIERACTSKLVFRSRAQVVKWIRAHPRGMNMSKCVPYLCPHCHQWHTTKARP